MSARWARVSWIVAATLGAPCAACALIAGIQQPHDKADGGTNAGDAGAGDTGLGDTGAGDTVLGDTGAGAGDADWCTAHFSPDAHIGFCDDFDHKSVVTDGWEWDDPLGDSSTVELGNPPLFVSFPHSVQTFLAAGNPGCNQVHLQRLTTSTSLSSVHAEAQLFVQGAQTGALYSLGLNGGSCQLSLSIDPQNAFVWESEQGGMVNQFHYLMLGFTDNGWQKVVFDVDLTTQPPTMNASINSQNFAGAFPIQPVCAGDGGVYTALGFFCFAQADGGSVQTNYDNVLTTLQP